jgi:outer membrane lipoprotein-sorting protein
VIARRTDRRISRAVRALAAAALFLAVACGGKVPALPSGNGSPYPDAPAAYTEATAQCRGVKTLSAEIGLSGRAAGSKVRGRIVAGFASPGKVRLEAPAPFGRPVFTLVARDDKATLVLNRDRRVIRDAAPTALVEALAGVPMSPDDLRGAVAGCGFGGAELTDGESFPNEWIAGESGGARVWLHKVGGAWRLVAASRNGLEIRYDQYASGRPAQVRLRATNTDAASTDLTLQLSQVDVNVPLEDRVFDVEIPDDAAPITLDELRRSGTLGGTSGGSTAPEPRRS